MCLPVVKVKKNKTMPLSSSAYAIQKNDSSTSIESMDSTFSHTTIESVESNASSTPSSDSGLTDVGDDKPCFQLLMFLKSGNAERRNGLTYNGRNITKNRKISKTFDII